MSRPPSDWITLAEAGQVLDGANVHLRPETIGRWARDGRLQTLKLGGRPDVRRVEIRALLRPRRRVAAQDVQPRLFEDL
jgi:hypothetical protein